MWPNRKVTTSCRDCGPMATGHQCNISSQNTCPPTPISVLIHCQQGTIVRRRAGKLYRPWQCHSERGEKKEVALFSGLAICICLFERTALGMRSWPDGWYGMEWAVEGGGGDRYDPLRPYGKNYRARYSPSVPLSLLSSTKILRALKSMLPLFGQTVHSDHSRCREFLRPCPDGPFGINGCDYENG